MLPKIAHATNSAASERRFYARSRAFGRFGMRIFKPEIMPQAHHHGHVEANFARGCRLHYLMDGKPIVVEAEQLVLFWANVPHQLVAVDGPETAELCNIYLPLDAFLMMPHLSDLQIALLNGAMVICPPEACGYAQLLRWYEDYRSGKSDRLDILKMDLNVLFRRLGSAGLCFLRRPWLDGEAPNNLTSTHIRHVVNMVRHVLENLPTPLRNSDVTSSTGLHSNYALAIFTRAMGIPLKQFILRMRLLRARSLLLESDMAITTVAVQSGFGSTSQFYAHFVAAYGTTPRQLRELPKGSYPAKDKEMVQDRPARSVDHSPAQKPDLAA